MLYDFRNLIFLVYFYHFYDIKKSLTRVRDFSVKLTPYSTLLLPHNLDIVHAEYTPWTDQYHTPPN